MTETEKIKKRYYKRSSFVPANKYSLTNPHILMKVEEEERIMIKLMRKCHLLPLCDKKILEIGCGNGSNLLELIRFGADPKNIIGNDLLESRIEYSAKILPRGVQLICGEASSLNLESDSFDIILQSTVFTSILDDELQKRAADKMWALLKPGGYIIWYDFIHANPYNKDVKAIPFKKVKMLFPEGQIIKRKLTLFPFISECVTRHFYFPYYIFNLPVFRMHILCFIKKC